MSFLDWVFVAVLLFSAYKGFAKGVVATVSSVAGYIIGLIGTLVLYQPLAIILGRQMGLTEKLSPWVSEKLSLPAASFETKITDTAIDQVTEIINSMQMPDLFKNAMIGYTRDIADLPVSQGIESIGQGVAYSVSEFLISAISFFLIYVTISLVFRVMVPKIFNAVSPRPVKLMDKVGGAVLGCGGGILSIIVLITVLTPFVSLAALKGNPSPLANQMQSSVIVNFFVNNVQSLI